MKLSTINAILTILVILGCRSKPNPEVSFYYWKTVFQLSPSEKQILKTNGVTKLYIRYFDISLDPKTKKPVPESPIVFKQKTDNFIIVPVVYIKNEVFLNEGNDINDLASKVYDFIEQINNHAKIKTTEIQVDCDWTLTSRDKYLEFIKLLKKESKKILSATIRLHQVKYAAQTKIPEVDYGVLMYYNMGKLDANSKNSIYDKAIAEKYLPSLKSYPLPLKIALPIFSWGVHIRNKRIVRLISKISLDNFQKDDNFVIKGNLILAEKSSLKFGYYLKKGDQIRLETITPDWLNEMKTDLARNLKTQPTEILFYDLDSINLNRYDKAIFKKLAHSF